MKSVHHNVAQFNPQNIANTLLALDQMGLKWVDVDRGLQDKLLKSVHHNAAEFNPHNIANTLFALDGMGCEVEDLKEVTKVLFETVTRLSPSFGFREILSCAEAFDHIGFFWQDFPTDFQSQFLCCIKEIYPSLRSHESGMLMLRLSRLLVPSVVLESFALK